MSQLQTVLRRSVAHLDPSDFDGRERMFTSAREAMIRLLWSYDPPLTPSEIDSKIEEFDGVATRILQEEPEPAPELEAEPELEPEPEAEESDEPDDEESDESEPSSRNAPEPEAVEMRIPDIRHAPEPVAFSPTMALPPRDPIRKLARFEPLSQIGSPTPGKDTDANRALDATKASDANKASDAVKPAAVPGADAAVIAALAALDKSVSNGRATGVAAPLPGYTAGPVHLAGSVQPAGPVEAATSVPATSSARAIDPAKATAVEARSTQPAVHDDDASPDAVNPIEDAADEDTRDEGLFEVRDGDLLPDAPDETGDGAPDDDESPYPDDDDASLEDEDQDRDDDPYLDDADRDEDGEPDRISAEDELRYHRERFDDPAGITDERDEHLADEPRDEDPIDADEAEPRPEAGEPSPSETNRNRTIAVLAGIGLLIAAGIGGAAYLFSRGPAPAVSVSETAKPAPTPEPARPTDIAGVIEAAPETPPSPSAPDTEAQPRPAPTAPETASVPKAQPSPAATAPDVAAGALALETLNLFDGRDPSVFQSAPANPVRFEGDTQGGFARVSSSTNSTGSRITVGRGVYERLAGRTIRIVVVARAAKTNPANSLRFAYQHGRSLSPWHDGALGPDYAPMSTIWTVPKERGGPETDAVLIEPGIPGDGTAADIKSVRIEVLK